MWGYAILIVFGFHMMSIDAIASGFVGSGKQGCKVNPFRSDFHPNVRQSAGMGAC